MSTPFDALLDEWRHHPDDGECLVHERTEPPAPGRYAELDPPPPPPLVAALAEVGIARLYRHQVAAIERVRRGTDTVLVAGTAAGKSLAYRLPIAETISSDPDATALLVYPTKALGRDQMSGFGPFLAAGVVPAIYDGDTPRQERRWVRDHANTVLTNPEMLHVGILPHHPRWARFLGGLRLVVVDELHRYRGAFGTHVAMVVRRLRRIAGHYGADPTFVFTSATIGNPGELASALTGTTVSVVDEDTSPRGPRTIVVWNPALEDAESGTRASALADAARIFARLVDAGIPTILFARSRTGTELAYRWALDRLDEDAPVAAYRAGYRPEMRRDVERRLFAGELTGIVATNALELGIDVGSLDAAVLAGFPGTIASFRQQVGRAGRGDEPSLGVLVAGADALDQYYAGHPEELFDRRPEVAVVNPENETILDAHLRCAAHELPLRPDDRRWFGEPFEERVTALVTAGELGIRGGRVFSPTGRSPAATVDLRGSGGAELVIVDDHGTIIGTTDEERAMRRCHPGAVYLHSGDAYLVDRLDLVHREVRVHREKVAWYTRSLVEKDLDVLREDGTRRVGDLTVAHGRVVVRSRVVAYRRQDVRTGAALDTVPLDLPERRFATQAVWYVFSEETVADAALDTADLPGAIHAAEHTAIGVLPLFAVCDRWDVGGLSTPFHPWTASPVMFIYDGTPGGTGIAPIAFASAERHLAATIDILASCPCAEGCPSCVQSPKCGNLNEPLDRFGALRLLRAARAASPTSEEGERLEP